MTSFLFGLLATTTLYAFLLSTKIGQEWTDEQTWTTVVGGVLLVVGWLWLEDENLAVKVLTYFAVAGTPMVFRSLVFQFIRNRKALRRLIKGGD